MDLNLSEQNWWRKFRQEARLADYLVLLYGAWLIFVAGLFYQRLGSPIAAVSADCGLVFVTLLLIFRPADHSREAYRYLQALLPLLTFAFFYTQSTAWDNLFFPHTFDRWLINWDQALFGRLLHTQLAPAANSLVVSEIMHFFYFSYYLLLFIPVLYLLYKRSAAAYEIIFNLTFMMYVHYLFFMVFPADGPVAEHQHLFGRGVVFIPLMNLIYEGSGQQGGGTFPSTHVASAVMVFIYGWQVFRKLRPVFTIVCCGIILATVYCSYHYAIDALAGMISGTVFYFLGRVVYFRWNRVPQYLSQTALEYQ